MRKFIILIILLIPNLDVLGQISIHEYEILKSNIPEETVGLQINSKLLLAGEYMYYSVTCFNTKQKNYSHISKLAYVELVGLNKKIIFKHKLKTITGTANGSFFIPTSVKSGQYKLIAYTNWSLNNSSNAFSEININIINPYTTENQNIDEASNSPIDPIAINKSQGDDLKNELVLKSTSVSINKDEFTTRDQVTLTILDDGLLNNSIYNLSVRQVDSIEILNSNEKPIVSKNKSGLYYLPELRGEIVSGTLYSKNNLDLSNQKLSLSFSESNTIVLNANTNENGDFYFTINDNYHNSKMNIQVLGDQKNDYDIILDDKLFNAYDQLQFQKTQLNSNIKSWLERESILHQIDNAYFNIKSDSIMPNNDAKLFYQPLETKYLLDDYTRFKTVRETFIEIINTAAVIKNNSSYEFKVPDLVNLDYSRNYNYIKPVILVDGLILQDYESLFNYSSYKIKSISTITGFYIFGSHAYNGVISIETINKDFHEIYNHDFIKTKPIENVLASKIYYQPDYNNSTTLNRIPDYRKQLLWKPNMSLNNSETVVCYTSDRTGLFEVILETLTPEGQKLKITKYFTVN